ADSSALQLKRYNQNRRSHAPAQLNTCPFLSAAPAPCAQDQRERFQSKWIVLSSPRHHQPGALLHQYPGYTLSALQLIYSHEIHLQHSPGLHLSQILPSTVFRELPFVLKNHTRNSAVLKSLRYHLKSVLQSSYLSLPSIL